MTTTSLSPEGTDAAALALQRYLDILRWHLAHWVPTVKRKKSRRQALIVWMP